MTGRLSKLKCGGLVGLRALARTTEAGVYADRLLTDGTPHGRRETMDLEVVRTDGRRAFDEFVTANLSPVVSIAKRYVNRGLDFLDLI